MTHTPGPWRAAQKPSLMWHVYGSDHAAVCFTAAATYKKSAARREADARLIASAPDLLAATEAALAYCEHIRTSMFGVEPAHAEQLRAAIAKATGQ